MDNENLIAELVVHRGVTRGVAQLLDWWRAGNQKEELRRLDWTTWYLTPKRMRDSH
jgi:hypothetical protein